LLVGAGTWTGSQFAISAIGSIDYCDIGGFQFPGWVDGNAVKIKVYKASEGIEFTATATYQAGSGHFGDMILSISELNLVPIGGPCYTVEIENTGVAQLIIFQSSITSLEPGDEIGIFDENAITNFEDCSNQTGELLVGAGTWTGSQFAISAIGSIDYCDIGGFQFPGWVDGNEVTIRVCRPGEEVEYSATATYQAGSGHFGDMILSISELVLVPIDEIVGCMDETACNYDPDATIDDGCLYDDCLGECGGPAEYDECGECDGPGIPPEECDCEGNVLGCDDVCGSGLVFDECGECDGPGIPPEECDCEGNVLGCDDVCGSGLVFDECGECGGPGIPPGDCDCEENIDDCLGECGGTAYYDDCDVCDDDPSNDCIPNQYFTPLPPETGVSSLIIVNVTGGLNQFDEVGLFDMAGVTNYDDCSNQIGEILVGASVYNLNQLNMVAIGSTDNCSFGGTQLSGYVAGNPIYFKVWDSVEECGEYALPSNQIVYTTGNGTFGSIVTVANIDANRYGCMDMDALNYDPCATAENEGDCQYFITQSITLQPLRWNNISFYLTPTNPAVEDVFPASEFLIVTNDQSQYYLPGFGVNTIGEVECTDGYMSYLSGSSPFTIEVEGYGIVPSDCPIPLSPLFWNNVAYQLQSPMSVVTALAGLPILLVQDDAGHYYLPAFNVNTIDASGGMMPGKGYKIYLAGTEGATLIYPSGDGLARVPDQDYLYNKYEASIPQHYQIDETGISHPIVINSIQGDVQVGDELVAYAHGVVVGAVTITDLKEPTLLVAWQGYNDYDIQLDGWHEGDQINLKLWSQSTNVEKFVSTDLSNDYFGVDPLTTGSIIVSDELAVPIEFALSPAYPNPFNPVTTISYNLPEASVVMIDIYDMTGQLVTNLVSKESEAGYYSVTWNANNQASGVYFVKLTAGHFSDIQKIMLVK